MSKYKSASGWAVTHWKCGIYIDTASSTRTEAITIFKRLYRKSDKQWESDRKYGVHRCIKVTVSP